MNIEQIIEQEPEVNHLISIAKNNKTAKYQTRLEIFEYDLKPAIERIIGFNSKNPELRSYNAYGLVLDKVAEALKI